MSDASRQGPIVNGSQVVAAGFASATAAFVTSRFGVTGTLLGAALTAMIITGGSAILKGYFESVTGNVRNVPNRLRTRANRLKAMRYAEPDTLPERPDLRDNFAGRMRAALGWFSHLPPLSRRSILVKGLIAAAVAFVIGMGAVYAIEKGIGNSLSCGLWSNCPEGAKPGIHVLGDRDAGAGSSISLGRAKTKEATPAGYEDQEPAVQRQNVFQQQEDRSYQQEGPGYRQQPADSGGGESRRGVLDREQQVEQREPAQQQEPAQQEEEEVPSSASPAPEEEPVQEVAPSGESPAPSQQ